MLNGVSAINSAENTVEIMALDGDILATESGTKQVVADKILNVIQRHLIKPAAAKTRP